ncbi:MAG TPA: hypothetical protein VKR21_17745 [Solirubrobacteraceae bacterium]|nr:hypothetical protein [Solirubrobacteraceae bacterium]
MVNRFLRTAPTRTLLGAIAGVVAIIAGGTAIALAAQGSGPVPKPKPLARAVRDALAAPRVKGISADISFTNGLIGASELQGTDPLLQGGNGHVWVSGDGRFRLELYGDNGDPEIVVNHSTWWVSDPTLQTVYEGTLPAGSAPAAKHHQAQVPTVAEIQTDINRLARHLNLSHARPTDVGGQPTYTVSVSPKQAGGLVGQLQLAWDAVHGVPLRFAVYARGDSKPVLQLAATNIGYGAVAASVFNLAPPSGYSVVKVATPSQGGAVKSEHKHGTHSDVTGVRAVAKHVGFTLSAPATLAGRTRQSVSLLGKGALLIYGQGPGAIAVVEEPATASSSRQLQLSRAVGDHQRGITLPTFSAHGATAQELDTALGTLVRFTSGGVSYTVAGSVRPAVARAAARGL